MRLEGHVAIVTGVSHAGQVGYALAAAFAREGAHLAISARGAKRMHARAEELRGAGRLRRPGLAARTRNHPRRVYQRSNTAGHS
jgi:NAD(P)-dependent dehydrogenase (short-subunit alcohol dehydrogenase family)